MGGGGKLDVGANVSVLIPNSQTISDGGALKFATNDTVTFDSYVTVAISGTMTAMSDSFVTAGGNGDTAIQVNNLGELTAQGSTFTLTQLDLNPGSLLASTDLQGDIFNTTLSVPYGDVQYLADNASFQDIDITGGPLTGTLSLNQIGTGSAPRYVFPQGFTVGGGGKLDVGANVSVLIPNSQTISDGGTLKFATNDTVTFDPDATVAVSGTMTAMTDSFVTAGGNGPTAIQVNSGGGITVFK